MSVKHKFNTFEKMDDILIILVNFCGNFSLFWQFFFCYLDPFPDPFHETDSTDQNKTDPRGSGSEKY